MKRRWSSRGETEMEQSCRQRSPLNEPPKKGTNKRPLVTYHGMPNVGIERCKACQWLPVTRSPARSRVPRGSISGAVRNSPGALESEVEFLKSAFRPNTALEFPLDSQIGFRYVPGGYAR